MTSSYIHMKGNEKGAAILYRMIGSFLATAIKSTAITPNQLSASSFILGLFAAIFFATGNYSSGLIGVFLYQLCILMDYSDGTLARLKNMTSFLGQWYEAVLDPLREFAVIFGICWGLYAQTEKISVWVLGFLMVGTNFIMDILALTYEAFPFASGSVRSFSSKSIVYRIASHFVTMRTTRYIATVAFALGGWMYEYLIVFSVYNAAVLSLMILQFGKIISRQDKKSPVTAEENMPFPNPPDNIEKEP